MALAPGNGRYLGHPYSPEIVGLAKAVAYPATCPPPIVGGTTGGSAVVPRLLALLYCQWLTDIIASQPCRGFASILLDRGGPSRKE